MNFPEVNQRSKIGRAYEILNTFNGLKQSDDRDTRALRLVMAMMDSVYAEVLQEDITRRENVGQSLDPQNYFPYRCVPILVGDSCESCDKEFYVNIPNLAQYNGSPIISNVYVGDLPSAPAKDRLSARVMANGGIGKESPSHYVQGGKIYFLLPGKFKMIKYVSFDIIPSNPSGTTVDKDDCFDIWSSEYPILDYLWPITRDRVSQRLMNPLIQTQNVESGVNDGMK